MDAQNLMNAGIEQRNPQLQQHLQQAYHQRVEAIQHPIVPLASRPVSFLPEAQVTQHQHQGPLLGYEGIPGLVVGDTNPYVVLKQLAGQASKFIDSVIYFSGMLENEEIIRASKSSGSQSALNRSESVDTFFLDLIIRRSLVHGPSEW